jgi:hypothetical protein
MGITRSNLQDIGRAAATVAAGGNPLAGALAGTVLQVILNLQSEELKRLEAIRADTQALVQEPYNTAMEYSRLAAQPHRREEDKRKFIEDALRNFMRAYGQAQDLFRQALIEYQLGICSILLSRNEDARERLQSAYYAAADYWAHGDSPLYKLADALHQLPEQAPDLALDYKTDNWGISQTFFERFHHDRVALVEAGKRAEQLNRTLLDFNNDAISTVTLHELGHTEHTERWLPHTPFGSRSRVSWWRIK